MVVWENFVKDAIAIGSGACLGTFVAYALEIFWFFGILIGGASGYVFRLLLDPERILWAGRAAWKQLLSALQKMKKRWTPVPGWENRIVPYLYSSLALGGFAGVFVGGISFWVYIFFEEMNVTVSGCIETYVFGAFSTASVVMLTAIDGAFFPLENYKREFTKGEIRRDAGWALYFNIIAIHFTIIYGVLGGLFLLGLFAFRYIAKIPRALLILLQIALLFLKHFIRIVHSETYTSCALYAAVVTFLAFFTASRDPLFLTAAWAAGGIMGAGMRRVVLSWLPPELEVSPRQ